MMSDKNNTNEIIIPLKNLVCRTVQKDDASLFESSFFKNIYNQAAELTNVIIQANEKKDLNITHGIPLQQTFDIQNVIAFTGRRGTGKTSTMLAFADALATGKYNDGVYSNLKNKQFFSIQHVDSSSVSENEDFFEILLFKMLQFLNLNVENYNRNSYFQYDAYLNDLRENIVRVYNHYTSIRHNSNFDFSSSYSIMKKNIEKHDIKRELTYLIKEYTEFLCMLKNEKYNRFSAEKNGYLVICIDDIDMSRKNHLKIMQCINQYFMVPGVIVMITLNIPVLSAALKKDFYSTMNITNSGDEFDKTMHLSQEQTSNFLRKIIPSDMRITMPSWRKIDYKNLSPIKLSFKNIGNETEALEMFPNLKGCKWYRNDKDDITPKELVMLLLADRTKVCLDVKGNKPHFMEPDSLRNLYDLFYLLYHMKNIISEQNDETNYHALEYNRRILLNFLYFKMIPEYNFSYDIQYVFEEFQADPMYRRGRRIWDFYYNAFIENESKIKTLYGEAFFTDEKNRYKAERYSFGEFFKSLYLGSRLNIMQKNFVKAILASFSFTLPQYVELEKKKKKEHDEKIKIKGITIENEDYFYEFRELRDIFEYTFLGSWCEDLYGKDKSNNYRQIAISIDKDIFNDRIKKYSTKKTALTHLVYLLLLSSRSTKEAFKVTEKQGLIMIDAKLDPTAFILGTIRVTRVKNMNFRFNEINLTLSELLNRYNINVTEEDICNVIKQIYESSKDILWFLLKHTDITYNVIKRTISYFIYSSDGNLQVKSPSEISPYNLFKKFYKRFMMKLEEQFKVYTETYSLNEYNNKRLYDEKYFLYNKTQNKISRYKDLEKGEYEHNSILPIITWFIETKDYGKLCTHNPNYVSNNLFNYYGCGLEWTNEENKINLILNNSDKYYTLYNYLKFLLDSSDFKCFEEKFNIYLYIKVPKKNILKKITNFILQGEINNVFNEINTYFDEYELTDILKIISTKTLHGQIINDCEKIFKTNDEYKYIKTDREYLHRKINESQRDKIINAVKSNNNDEIKNAICEIVKEFNDEVKCKL